MKSHLNFCPNYHQAAAMPMSRRDMLQRSTLGMGSIAMASMMADEAGAAPLAHQPARAKNIIFLFMSGGPGQTDTFDPKPLLQKLDGQPVPESIAVNVPKIPRSGVNSKLMASPFGFKKYGESGIEVSDLFP